MCLTLICCGLFLHHKLKVYHLWGCISIQAHNVTEFSRHSEEQIAALIAANIISDSAVVGYQCCSLLLALLSLFPSTVFGLWKLCWRMNCSFWANAEKLIYLDFSQVCVIGIFGREHCFQNSFFLNSFILFKYYCFEKEVQQSRSYRHILQFSIPFHFV